MHDDQLAVDDSGGTPSAPAIRENFFIQSWPFLAIRVEIRIGVNLNPLAIVLDFVEIRRGGATKLTMPD
jgi:hypothetical protein